MAAGIANMQETGRAQCAGAARGAWSGAGRPREHVVLAGSPAARRVARACRRGGGPSSTAQPAGQTCMSSAMGPHVRRAAVPRGPMEAYSYVLTYVTETVEFSGYDAYPCENKGWVSVSSPQVTLGMNGSFSRALYPTPPQGGPTALPTANELGSELSRARRSPHLGATVATARARGAGGRWAWWGRDGSISRPSRGDQNMISSLRGARGFSITGATDAQKLPISAPP